MKTKITKTFNIGSKVQWIWMGRPVKGTIKKIYLKPVSKELRGHLYKRNGSAERPAYLIKSEAGSEVLKIHSELRRTTRG
ncbi:DUF2945 domain-containing protein [Bdellovibrio sp. HCB337]|uniref:DUF2945 domain-containing protein n=1 Tax=Bdellovibrio sp. HCB337 TaxID=3394358 RepID=UPI0039A490C2